MDKYLGKFFTLLMLMILSGMSLFACMPTDQAPQTNQTPPAIPDDVLFVAPDYIIGDISPYVYGVNHGPWAIVTDKVMPLAEDGGFGMIRFPGGNWGDENELQTYHIDQFAALAAQLNSQVSLTVRLFNSTPEKAADLVRYANIDQGYNIRYWAIGNEPTLYATSRGATDYGVEKFNIEWRAFAEAMKKVDPSILLIGPELHQFGSDISRTPKDSSGLDWMTEFLKANGDLVDIISIHRYPFPKVSGGRAATIEELAASSAEWDDIISYLRGLISETTQRDLPIAVTEVNSHWTNAIYGEATPDSYANAVWWADVLGRMITNRVEIVNYFTLQSHPSIGGYGLFSRSDARPTYYIYQLYKQFGDQLVFSGCNTANISTYAALDEAGSLTLIIINLGADQANLPLVVEGTTRTPAEAWAFDEAELFHQIDLETVLSDGIVTISSQSILLIKFK